MSRRRFRWTRERYERAQHLNRLLQRLDYYGEKPVLVERLHLLWDRTPGLNGSDPLTSPLRYRLEIRNGGIPF